jgi:hypothetical protein
METRAPSILDRKGSVVHARAGRHTCAVVSDKGVWLPCQLLKGLGGHAGALLFWGERRWEHMGAGASAVVVEWRLYFGGSGQGVRGMEHLVSTQRDQTPVATTS